MELGSLLMEAAAGSEKIGRQISEAVIGGEKNTSGYLTEFWDKSLCPNP
jgi:hypothetical protein